MILQEMLSKTHLGASDVRVDFLIREGPAFPVAHNLIGVSVVLYENDGTVPSEISVCQSASPDILDNEKQGAKESHYFDPLGPQIPFPASAGQAEPHKDVHFDFNDDHHHAAIMVEYAVPS